MHRKLSSFNFLEKDIAAILMPQNLQGMARSQNVAAEPVQSDLIISCYLAYYWMLFF